MFTGIVEATARVLKNSSGELTLARPESFDDIKEGSSISISGVCLTITKFDQEKMSFQMVEETLQKSSLGSKKEGDMVNVERAMAANGRFDGHVVQGHVEGVGSVIAFEPASIPQPLPPEEEGEERQKAMRYGKTPENILFYAREMRKEPTETENLLWQQLRHDQLGIRFRRQYTVGGRIVDFFSPSLRLAIEVDGNVHDSENAKKEDALRDQYLQSDHQITTLRFTNTDVTERMGFVLSEIKSFIKLSPPPPLEEGLGVEAPPEGMTLTLEAPKNLLPFIIPKGSITLDGVSLTIASVTENNFSIALIPYTLQHTTLGLLKEGDQVNMETDVLVRAVLKNQKV